MKRWKKWALLLLGLVLLSQSPFIYRRYQLRQLRAQIHELNQSRSVNDADAYNDYKGVVHVHSSLGGHSTGTPLEIIQAAQRNGLGFVVMTEHPSPVVDTSELTLKGFQGGVLFINGSELVTKEGDRFLTMPGSPGARTANTRPSQEIINEERANNRLSFIAYPQDYRSWETTEAYDGIEVYNLYTNARRINPLLMFFDGLWSYGSYADLLFTRFYERPHESLKRWDERLVANRSRRLVALAGNDAHQNVGISLGDAGGKRYLGILLDPYERSFQIVRTHALIEKDKALTAESLLEAIRGGRCYIAFDILADSTGFRFTAHNGSETAAMGGALALGDGVRLKVITPIKARVLLFRDGQRVEEAPDLLTKEFAVGQPGVYRVEVYLDSLGSSFKERPWIISNPIYVE